MMAVTGMIFEITKNPDAYQSVSYGTNISIPASLQILAFVLGTMLLILYGAKMLQIKSEPTNPLENAQRKIAPVSRRQASISFPCLPLTLARKLPHTR